MTNLLPPRVAEEAMQLGAHNDCIAAGPSGACANCEEIIMHAMHKVYGYLGSSREVIAAIFADLQEGE